METWHTARREIFVGDGVEKRKKERIDVVGSDDDYSVPSGRRRKKREIVCRFPRIKSRERKSHGENITSQNQSNNFLVLELLPKSFLDPNPSVRRKKPVARSPTSIQYSSR